MLIRREVVVNKTWKVVLAIVLLGLVALPAAARHGSHKNTGRDPDAPYATVQLHDVSATVGFSPRGQAQDLVVQAIASAKTQVLVQAYGFSNTAILKALTDAKNRGVDVRVILDKSNDKGKYSGATYMANAGIPVWIDYKPAIAHNKVMIIDEQDVITGSFNFTEAAQEHNAENVLFLQSVPELATVYAKDWQWRQGQSRQYQSVN
jgi:phosphatidylserine/phosphatidylglycerophosphate/cardiolipin synthase-like enzyme